MEWLGKDYNARLEIEKRSKTIKKQLIDSEKIIESEFPNRNIYNKEIRIGILFEHKWLLRYSLEDHCQIVCLYSQDSTSLFRHHIAIVAMNRTLPQLS